MWYNLKEDGKEAQVRSDLIVKDKRLAWINFEDQTVSFVESDVPISVIRDIVNNWDCNLRTSQKIKEL